jgi:hypothetical protein
VLAPAERPLLVQALSADDVASWTSWAADSTRIPPYPARAAAPVASARQWAWWASAGAGVAAGALLGGAHAADANYRESTSISVADERRAVVNGLAGASAAAGATAVGLGVLALGGSF